MNYCIVMVAQGYYSPAPYICWHKVHDDEIICGLFAFVLSAFSATKIENLKRFIWDFYLRFKIFIVKYVRQKYAKGYKIECIDPPIFTLPNIRNEVY